MSHAAGPPCTVCRKRLSIRRVTRCPWCRTILCLDCTCPLKCAERFTAIKDKKP